MPGNQLETLKRDRAGQHGIRIDEQYRVCFVWSEGLMDEGGATEAGCPTSPILHGKLPDKLFTV